MITNIDLKDTTAIALRDLEQYKISPQMIQKVFESQHQININWSEILKVSKENEGKDIRFETYDGHSTTLPIRYILGAYNKWQ